ncbi:hypothetical protein DFP72DRAFT_1152042 [Ephemerocybe angulata]|uniref:Uncharacterized protein n=1 Tax=Ephemerocybe angulata TaxID=980116 RepID=A0A8H6HIX0_9AGAR|nr:hypothetical protein DFP72DRAFT_1152042 [Tulosesus angulatus]
MINETTVTSVSLPKRLGSLYPSYSVAWRTGVVWAETGVGCVQGLGRVAEGPWVNQMVRRGFLEHSVRKWREKDTVVGCWDDDVVTLLGSNSNHYGSVLRLPSSSPRTRGIDILAWNGSVISWCKASPKDSWARMEIRRWAISSTRNAQHSDSALAGRRAVHLPCGPFPPPIGTDMDHGHVLRPRSPLHPALCSASSRAPPTLADAFACPWGNSEAPADVPVYRGILSSGMGRTGESSRPFPTLVPHVYASKIYPPRPRRTSPPHLQGVTWGRERGEEKEDAKRAARHTLEQGYTTHRVKVEKMLDLRVCAPPIPGTCRIRAYLSCYNRVLSLAGHPFGEMLTSAPMGVSTSKLDAVHVFDYLMMSGRVLLADASGMEFASFDAWPQAIDVLSESVDPGWAGYRLRQVLPSVIAHLSPSPLLPSPFPSPKCIENGAGRVEPQLYTPVIAVVVTLPRPEDRRSMVPREASGTWR